jgi:DNA-binding NarL/FixJ family response regulator
MTGTSTATPTRTIAIISGHYLVCLGLQNILEGSKTGHVVHLHPRITPDLLLGEEHPDVFVLDLETDQDAIDTIR